MNIIRTISNGLARVEKSLIVLLLGGMIVLAFLQVILRNVFSMGFLWADPFLRHLVLWIGFLGASLATQQEKQINLDIVTRFVSGRTTNLIRIITNLFAGMVTVVLAHAGWIFLQSEIETADILLTIGSVNFPAWWFQLIIPLGFGLMGFRFLLRTIDHMIAAFHPPAETGKAENIPRADP